MKLWIIAGLSTLVALYVIGGRKWLKSRPWMVWLYQSPLVQWVELRAFKKSESILWGRFLQALGYGLSFVASFGGIDLTPLAAVLPDGWSWVVPVTPLIIALAGHIQVQLRLETTKPIELVALPDAVPPDVAQAADTANAVNAQAVAVVTQAKRAGDV